MILTNGPLVERNEELRRVGLILVSGCSLFSVKIRRRDSCMCRSASSESVDDGRCIREEFAFTSRGLLKCDED